MPTSELYSNADDPKSVLGAPPSAPAPVPPADNPIVVTKTEIVNQPVVTKTRMADEGPDGKVRDTSTEAMRPSNDLNFRNITEEDDAARAAAARAEKDAENAKAAAEAKPEPVEAAKPAETAPPAEKVYAGKFKSVEELEKGYLEAQKAFHQKATEAAVIKQQQEAVPQPKTPAQMAAEEAQKAQFLERFVKDPEGVINEYQQKATQQTAVALAAQQVATDWRKSNPDIAEHEVRVAFEANLLAQSDPELAKDYAALINRATEQFRQFTGKLRNEGAKEALTQETRVIALLNPTATSSSEQPSPQAKAPLSSDESYAIHMKMLKDESERSRRGLRR